MLRGSFGSLKLGRITKCCCIPEMPPIGIWKSFTGLCFVAELFKAKGATSNTGDPQHRLNLRPLPHWHREFLPVLDIPSNRPYANLFSTLLIAFSLLLHKLAT